MKVFFVFKIKNLALKGKSCCFEQNPAYLHEKSWN
jgi:hypothetical protein